MFYIVFTFTDKLLLLTITFIFQILQRKRSKFREPAQVLIVQLFRNIAFYSSKLSRVFITQKCDKIHVIPLEMLFLEF